MNGYVQIYTGQGKGKTTAAIGLAVRAAGAGLKVFFAQFIKTGNSSEVAALKRFSDLITFKHYGRGNFIFDRPDRGDIAAANKGLDEVRIAMSSGLYSVIIMDEANCAVRCGLFDVDRLLKIIDEKPANVELVITGRDAHPAVIEKAHLVTEMNPVKHYYSDGVKARRGIEL